MLLQVATGPSAGEGLPSGGVGGCGSSTSAAEFVMSIAKITQATLAFVPVTNCCIFAISAPSIEVADSCASQQQQALENNASNFNTVRAKDMPSVAALQAYGGKQKCHFTLALYTYTSAGTHKHVEARCVEQQSPEVDAPSQVAIVAQ